MPLSAGEKRAGRAFRDACQAVLDARNEKEPPGVLALPLWRVVRHECPAAGGASIGITLRETCEPSPEYWACYCGGIGTWSWQFPHWDCDGGKVVVAGGRFTWIWKEGKCPACGLTARTGHGHFIVTADRLPGYGRSSDERKASSHHRDPRVPGA